MNKESHYYQLSYKDWMSCWEWKIQIWKIIRMRDRDMKIKSLYSKGKSID